MVSYKDFFSVKDSRTLLEGNRYASNRLLAKYLEKQLGQSVIVENRPGGGGVICWAAVSRVEPDGYTLGFLSNGTLTAKYTEKDVMFSYKILNLLHHSRWPLLTC
jgi:tripartite-type tricarboxylate transporter receptor subunit TctC